MVNFFFFESARFNEEKIIIFQKMVLEQLNLWEKNFFLNTESNHTLKLTQNVSSPKYKS